LKREGGSGDLKKTIWSSFGGEREKKGRGPVQLGGAWGEKRGTVAGVRPSEADRGGRPGEKKDVGGTSTGEKGGKAVSPPRRGGAEKCLNPERGKGFPMWTEGKRTLKPKKLGG